MTKKQKKRKALSILTLLFAIIVIGLCTVAMLFLARLIYVSSMPFPLNIFLYALILAYIVGVVYTCPVEDFKVMLRWARGVFIEEDEYNTRIGF